MTTEERIQKDAKQFDDGQPVYEFPANNAAYWRGVKHGFISGATKYYSIALEENKTFEAARNKENALALLNWMALNNYREVGVDSETGAYFAKFQGRVCCSDYYKPEQLYDLFIEQNKKV